mgnify:CR=1 FL=1
MCYILHFIQGEIKKIEDVVNIREFSHKLSFIFSNGSKLEIIKKYLLYYELFDDSQLIEDESEEVFNRFDNFVNRFIDRVEDRLAEESRYPHSVKNFRDYQNEVPKLESPKLKKVINLKP